MFQHCRPIGSLWRLIFALLLCFNLYPTSYSFLVVESANSGSKASLSPPTITTTNRLKNTIMNQQKARASDHDEITVVSECACGKVKLNIRLPSQPAYGATTTTTTTTTTSTAVDCHCPACRKYHVAAFASYLHVPSAKVEFTTDASSSLQSYQETCHELGPVERLFCKHCFSKVATTKDVGIVSSSSETEDTTKKAATAATTTSSSSSSSSSAIAASDNNTIGTSSPMVLVNMGGLVDTTIPKAYSAMWKKSRIAWQQSESQAVWLQARPPLRQQQKQKQTQQQPDHPMPPLTTGSCACGKCRYMIRHVPNEMQHCYCRLCRQYSGSIFQTWIPVHKKNFVWTSSSSSSTTTTGGGGGPLLQRTTNHGSRHICTTCASVMTIVYDADPDIIWPAAGGLDDASLPASSEDMSSYMDRVCHICCTWKPKWYDIPKDGLERVNYAC